MPYNSVFKPGLFAGKTMLVTGAGSGFGRCIATNSRRSARAS